MASKLVVIGTGLIGGSLALAAKQSGKFDQVCAVNRSSSTNEQVLALSIADHAVEYGELGSLISDLQAGDIVVVAVPVRVYEDIFRLLREVLPSGVVLTDVGSAKVSVMRSAEKVWGSLPSFFVPGHPIAGSEQSGVEASNSRLFVNRRSILTPDASTDVGAIGAITELWEAVGSEVDLMGASHHDDVLGATSHLPHVLAYTIVDALCTLEQNTEIFRYAAGGFRDFTRIAESDPVMWRDIFLSNRDAILRQLDNFEAHLKQLRVAIDSADGSAMDDILERAQSARKLFSQSQDSL